MFIIQTEGLVAAKTPEPITPKRRATAGPATTVVEANMIVMEVPAMQGRIMSSELIICVLHKGGVDQECLHKEEGLECHFHQPL